MSGLGEAVMVVMLIGYMITHIIASRKIEEKLGLSRGCGRYIFVGMIFLGFIFIIAIRSIFS